MSTRQEHNLSRRCRDSKRIRILVGLALALVCTPLVVQAQNTFTGTGNWTEAARWSGGVPGPGETVVIDGAVTLTNATEYLASYTLNSGRTNTFDSTNAILQATNATINGRITHNGNTDTASPWVPDNCVYIVCSNLTVASPAGSINVSGQGYRSALNHAGYGPGGGGIYTLGGGGGYGGRGGHLSAGICGGPTYGSSNAPVDPGSGGGGGGYSAGGYGGGAVRIQASGQVTVDGTISSGGSGGGTRNGGGSGGGIYIDCDTFQGNGVISATGGNAGGSDQPGAPGGGGGGRIAIIYNSVAQSNAPKPTVQFSASGGPGYLKVWNGDTYWGENGYPGTLYLPNAYFFPTETLTAGYQIIIPGFTNWAPGSLTVSSNVYVDFPLGVHCNVTNDVKILGSSGRLDLHAPLELGGDLTVEGRLDCQAPMTCGSNMTILNTLYLTNSVLTNALLTCGGNLTVTNSGTNSGAFYVYSGMTNSTWPNYGGLVRVTGDVFVASNSYIYPYSHPTNGGSVFFSVRNLTLASNGAINATGLGYAGVVGTNGLGPGRGYMKDDWVGSGAGYGGAGGAGGGTGPAGGTTYGSSNAPVDPGSSGGGSKPGGVYKQGGNGGGSVRIQASQRVTVNGAISAAGNAAGGSYGGGGSGGGIYVHCREFCGSGTITAIGGNGGHPTAGGGGGGGGRIAVWREYDHSSGLTNYVTGGTGTVSGGLGTVVFVLIPHKGTIISVR